MQNIQPLGKATNEVQRAEIDRLRDELARERGQHARDKEGQRRQHDNKAEIMIMIWPRRSRSTRPSWTG